jgi:hypothetical protein
MGCNREERSRRVRVVHAAGPSSGTFWIAYPLSLY